LFEDLRAEVVRRAGFSDAQVQRMQVAVAVANEAAEIGIGAQPVAGLFAVPDFVFVGEIMALPVCGVFFEIVQVPRLQRRLDKAAFQIALNAVFLDPLVDNVVATPFQVPQHVGDAWPVFLADLFQSADAIDELPAIPSGGAPADPVGFDERDEIAAFGQGQCGGNTGKAAANDANVGRDAAFQQWVVGDLIDRSGVIRAGVFLFLVACLHFVPCRSSVMLYLYQLIDIIQL